MTFTDRKFAARIKDSPYLLYFNWQKLPSEEDSLGFQSVISFHYVNPDPDLGNVSIYAARNILEEDVMYAVLNGLDTNLVEIIEIEVSYKFKNLYF
jgi:hypothetical protein